MLETSLFLARVIGLASVISVVVILLNYKKAIYFENELAKNPSSVYVSGFVFIVLGALIVVSHPIFEFSWRVVITLFGLTFLVKGIGRVLFPESVKRMIEKKQKNRWFIIGEIIFLLIGLYLMYYGFLFKIF